MRKVGNKKITMEKKVLGAYVSPKIVLLKIELEQGILASSATFTPATEPTGITLQKLITGWIPRKPMKLIYRIKGK